MHIICSICLVVQQFNKIPNHSAQVVHPMLLRNTTSRVRVMSCLKFSSVLDRLDPVTVRTVRTVRSTASSGSQVYESKRAVSEYLLAHYGDVKDQMPYDFGPKNGSDFSGYLAKLSIEQRKGLETKRALDIGCAVGGLAFRLTRGFDEVIGIDYSQHFVDAANEMKEKGQMDFTIMKQGNIFESRVTSFPDGIDRSKATFYQGDACNLDPSIGTFDLVIGANLMCRLPSPRDFLKSISNYLKPGGTFILVSPYSWLEEYTAKSEWIGAQVTEGGETKDSYQELAAFVEANSPSLKMVHREDIPFTIREHERKFQFGVSDCVVFTKSSA